MQITIDFIADVTTIANVKLILDITKQKNIDGIESTDIESLHKPTDPLIPPNYDGTGIVNN